jgi:sialate O-acetylesterase
MKKYRLLIFCFLIFGNLLYAAVKPANLFSEHMVLQRDVPIPVWGTAVPGEKITVSLNKSKTATRADASGRWKVKLKKQEAGGPYLLSIKGKSVVEIKDVYVGDVWLCSGQSNMDMTVAKEDRYWCGVDNEKFEVENAGYPFIRVFDVDFTPNNAIQTDVKGLWEVCSPSTVGHFSACAYFFAREIYNKYKIPIGLITSAYGASTAESWISEKSLKTRPNLKWLLDNYKEKYDKFVADSAVNMSAYREKMTKYEGDMAAVKAAAGDVSNNKAPKAPKNPDPMSDQHNPFVCYNGMIAPLIPYPICGTLWYQGESNGPSAKNYQEIMETLIADWRNSWGLGNFPFIYVQIANYGKPMASPVEDGPMMTIREAQVKNLSIPNTAMICAIENAGDNPTNIHPKNKQEIGYRLSLAARALAYGDTITYSGPTYRDYKIEGNSIRIFFDNTEEGIVAWNTKLTGFAICGEDRKFVWANARFDGNTVIVSSPSVPNPVAVRYCWGTNPPASLSNKDGLWTPNFRTDK